MEEIAGRQGHASSRHIAKKLSLMTLGGQATACSIDSILYHDTGVGVSVKLVGDEDKQPACVCVCVDQDWGSTGALTESFRYLALRFTSYNTAIRLDMLHQV